MFQLSSSFFSSSLPPLPPIRDFFQDKSRQADVCHDHGSPSRLPSTSQCEHQNVPESASLVHSLPPAGARGGSRAAAPELQPAGSPRNAADFVSPQRLSILSVNIGSLLSLRRFARLRAVIDQYLPHIILLQETWLDDSVEDVEIPGYCIVPGSRHDRETGPKAGYGGVLAHRRSDCNVIVSVCSSEVAERNWFNLHTQIGPLLLGNWYRAPDAIFEQVSSLRSEYLSLCESCIGTLICGDLNIHHREWLRNSKNNTKEGDYLMRFCDEFNLSEVVRKPTRKDRLLDLMLTDFRDIIKTSVLPIVSDHNAVLAIINTDVKLTVDPPRVVWDYKFADWSGLRKSVSSYDWGSILGSECPDSMVSSFVNVLLAFAKRYIPQRTLSNSRSSFQWVNARCKGYIERHNRENSAESLDACNQVLFEEHQKHVVNVRSCIAALPRSSKQYWEYNRQLMNRKSKSSSIAPLKSSTGEWVIDATQKADTLASAFNGKSELPPTYEQEVFVDPHVCLGNRFFIRTRWVYQILRSLDVSSSTGPDGLPGRILKELATVISWVVARLVSKLLHAGAWPRMWKYHWLHPLFKKGAVSNPNNYRGVHLTCVLSKVAERALKRIVVHFLLFAGAFGDSQWAYQTQRSCRDLVALLICRWLLAICRKHKVGIYLADISGAFDRVDSAILLAKLKRAGVGDVFLRFLSAYLDPRIATVLVQGHESDEFQILNQIFQGTVLGPSLWNLFFEDIDEAICTDDFSSEKFADDLTASKLYEHVRPSASIVADLSLCQSRVHRWGLRNRVLFDPSKEHFKVIDRFENVGEAFRLLGVQVDTKLIMDVECRRIVKKARPKCTAILRTSSYYSVKELLNQFKTHVLCLLEGSSCAVFHASNTHLQSLDRVQTSFVEKLGLGESEAFLAHNLAPLTLRRDIAALGFLHKIVLGIAHPAIVALFPMASPSRYSSRRHSKQFVDQIRAEDTLVLRRSLFGMCSVYNRLPQGYVNVDSVSEFQAMLVSDARVACQSGRVSWQHLFSCRPFGQ